MKTLIFKIARIVLIAFFILSTVFIVTCKFPNKDLDIKFKTDQGEYTVNLSVDEKTSNISNYIKVEIEEADIQEIRIYGDIKSIYLKKFSPNEFLTFIERVEDGEMQCIDDSCLLISDGNIKLYFNDAGNMMLKETLSSFFLERICLWGFLIVVVSIMFIICMELEKNMVSFDNNHTPINDSRRFIRDIKKYMTYMFYAAKTDLRAEVANSYLNRLWWILEPLFSMLVYVIVFGKVMGRSIENYAVFVYSALLMWGFFNKTINYSVKLIRNNRDIITKVYVPKFVLLITNMVLNIFKLFFSIIVLISLMLIFRVSIGIEILWVFPAYLVLILLAFAVGMIFLHYGVYVDDLSYAVSILLNMLMFLSGTFYNVRTTLTEPLGTIVLCVNPVALTIDTMRNALLYQEISNIPLILIWFLISIILSCIGVHIVYKNENGYVKVV